MPRDIPVGNGSLLVNFDKNYNIRDIYFPFVGAENHTIGHPCRFGVWADGQFSWMGDEWQRSLDYMEDTLVTNVTARSTRLEIEIGAHDTVDYESNVYVKEIKVKNLRANAREVRLFFNHDFHISGFETGDTAYYDPYTLSIIHYKGKRYFLINCCDQHKCKVDHFTTGKKEVPGTEGTWKDAEDGRLSENPIAQGSVDSTIGINLSIPARGEVVAYYWIAVGTTYEEVTDLNKSILDSTPANIINKTANYWRLWVNKEEFNFDGLPQKVVRLFKRSLLIIKTQIDKGGAILAANDFDITHFGKDTYSYMWPRDGAIVAYALTRAGYSRTTRRFFEFCADVIAPQGYLLHKYTPDKSIASSWHPWYRAGKREIPIQEDETALVIWSLWKHFEEFHDIELIRHLYKGLVLKAADFMVDFRDWETNLPLESYDLWEERYGVHTFTASTVVAGLRAAANFARAFGDDTLAQKYSTAAEGTKAAIAKHLYNHKEKCFSRTAVPTEDGYTLDMTVDASLYGLFAFGTFDANDPLVESTMHAIRDKLFVQTQVCGVARYEGDMYQRKGEDTKKVPGNPWFICTLWMAEYLVARARSMDEDMDAALKTLVWVADHALPSGVLAEQVHPYTNEPVSVSPLTWSHAAVVITVLEYLYKRQALTACECCGNPKSHVRRGHIKP